MLPKISHPSFTTKLPSTQAVIKYRPYTVKEEKILLIAQQDGSSNAIVDAFKTTVQNCVLTPNFNVNRISAFDLEYLFLKIRAKSVGNIIEMIIKDKEVEDDVGVTVPVNLDDVEMVYSPDHNPKIQVNETVGLVLRYPTLDFVAKSEDKVDAMFEMITECISMIYEGDKVMVAGTDFTTEEAFEFLNSLDKQTFEKIELFFETFPVLQHTVKYKNSMKEDKEITLKGLVDFFR
jgi:hypothetical protein